jgi:3-dehydroquinate synthase
VAKYGLIADPGFFAWLETNGARMVSGDAAALRRGIEVSCAAKAKTVAADEREGGLRELLNFGHTFGHALETETGFSDALLHGEAVSIGMVLAFDLSVRLGLCPQADAARAKRHLAAVGLPTDLAAVPGVGSAESLIAHMQQDKKARRGKLRFVLTHGIGKAFVTGDVGLDDVAAALDGARAA